MNSIERMSKVMTGQIPDRVPFFPTIYTDHACLACDIPFEDALINPSLGAECMLSAALKYKADAVRFCMGPETSWFHNKTVRKLDGKLLQYDNQTNQPEGFYDVSGGGIFVPTTPPPPVKTIADVNAMEVTQADQYLKNGCLDAVKRCANQAHEQGLFTVGMCSGQTINFMTEKLGSSELALMTFYDHPDLAVALIEKAVQISIQQATAFAQIGIDCIYIGDSYASASVISPDIYERFCAPAYKTMTQAVHDLGIFCYKHCCGNYNPLLHSLPAIGIDAMDGIDPTSGMSVEKTKQQIGSQITLMGGISCLTLANGTPQQVYDEAVQCINQGKPGGRYVLGSACAVPRNSPTQNLHAARKAIDDHGKY